MTDLNPLYVVYLFAAVGLVLVAEAAYLTYHRSSSYRDRVNRRLVHLNRQTNRENVLVQLRRERGLTAGGNYSISLEGLNRLILQSGLTVGIMPLAMMIAGGAGLVLLVVLAVRGSLLEALLAAVVAGIVVPYAVLRYLRSRRQKAFATQFPDAIDVVVRSLRAGHPVAVAIGMVAREMPDPVGTEFGIVADEITYGADLEAAMRSLSFRVGQDDLPLFVTAVAIQASTGGNLREILENLANVIRLRIKMRRKVSALSAEGRFSAIVLTGLPLLLFGAIQVIAPDFYGEVWDDSVTQIGLGLTAAWMIAGNIVMYKMINFRI